jgi:uncharacterized NAD(P)/FAD-binding protein YdhS/predicted metal-dependent enzyme (double-stranded beta helix superfamily)
MDVFSGPIAELVRRLDELRSDLTLIKIVGALEGAKLKVADVAAYVQETPRSYHRSTVVRREHYELLVLTWLPGQASVPHDHAGSISAMLVLQAEAAEGCWRIAADGYVDLEYETIVRTGELTAWQDAGVHTIRNASNSGETLVTVHVYTPTLRDFRRFVPRPRISEAGPAMTANESRTVVVVGGGFSGAMTAAQILRHSGVDRSAVHVTIVERQGAVGEGMAYSTREQAHLLNVPAGRMSAWPDRPNDFVQWVSRRYTVADPNDFLPRQWYGEYVRETLLTSAEEAGESVRLSLVFDEARRIARRPNGGWIVNLARGASLPADVVVLAIGHRPPADPIGRLWSGPRNRYIADPWRAFATNAVSPDEPVVILGSGLTAVDAVLSLNQEPRRAPITLISRRGLVPQAHGASPVAPANLEALVSELLAAPGGVRVKALFQGLRRKAAEVLAAGGNWRSVVDGLRPHTALLWRSMPRSERQKFFARLRPFWEVHRHRMALGVADRFGALHDQGLVRIVAGRVASVQAEEAGVRLYVREWGDERLREMHAGWVINCTGPAAANSAESNPAIGSLLVHGWVRQDELALGLDTSAEGNAINAGGEVMPDLFVVGTLRKPSVWESTAVPELRNQAAGVADCVLARLNQSCEATAK